MRICTECNVNKKNNDYYKGKSTCKDCYKARQLAKYHKAKPLRTCRGCGLKAVTIDELQLFAQCKSKKHGCHTICKECDNKTHKKYRGTPEGSAASKESSKKHYYNNQDEILQQKRDYMKQPEVAKARKEYEKERSKTEHRKEWSKNNRLKRTYGIDLQDKANMYAQQEGKCRVCNHHYSIDKLVIDHNHKTEEVRGLLCSPCNMALGLLKDNPDVLLRGAMYLQEEGYYG